MKLLLLDNYDSFTWNLAQYFGQLGAEVTVLRNDAIDLAGVRALQPARIVISPGPCAPAQAGVSLQLIRSFAGVVPILGVCLGAFSQVKSFPRSLDLSPKLHHPVPRSVIRLTEKIRCLLVCGSTRDTLDLLLPLCPGQSSRHCQWIRKSGKMSRLSYTSTSPCV